MKEALIGILIPFIGTTLGAACVYFMRGKMNHMVQRLLTGFAAGVMTAASIWSLLIPAMEQNTFPEHLRFIPAAAGFWAGIAFLLVLDGTIPHLHMDTDIPEGRPSRMSRTMMMVMAVTLHNLPEGMAVGVVYAGFQQGNAGITAAGAFALALGIAIQNFPEGAIISMPLHSEGVSRNRSFLLGTLSGLVEPVGAWLTILASSLVLKALPYLLSFAAGAMMYVVVEELIPEMAEGRHTNLTAVVFAFGFTLMMALDVALG
ncbi:MAG: ZIP family metal transporter [Solobacterium sp.]|nr:ZIP family metal transporter [Solobacterium sp.]